MYDPTVGRWLRQDPLFPDSGVNPYEYADDDPTNEVDPTGLAPTKPGLPVTEADKQLASIIDKIATAMYDQQWTPPPTQTGNPNPGAFGSAVHGQASTQLTKASEQWLVDVYVKEGTNEIVSIGKPPPGGVGGTIQVDAMYVEKGYKPKPGEILDTNKVKDLYDVKASLSGSINENQTKRLQNVLHGGKVPATGATRSPKAVASRFYYSPKQGFTVNRRFVRAMLVLGIAGAACAIGLPVYAMIRSTEYDAELDEIFLAMQQARKLPPGYDKNLLGGVIFEKLKNYLGHFGLDDPATNILVWNNLKLALVLSEIEP